MTENINQQITPCEGETKGFISEAEVPRFHGELDFGACGGF